MTTSRGLGKEIQKLRIQRGLSQQGLADKAGLSRIYIAKLEARDRISPSLPALERIAKALRVKVRVQLVK
jgi:transcriptional regulator with XRE-family HTH domain